MARAPKANMARVAAYEASPKAQSDWEAAKAAHEATVDAEEAAGLA